MDLNSVSQDSDQDSIPDCVDTDRDGDGFDNQDDAFPDDSTEWYDNDQDGIGDNKDPDLDNDGVENLFDRCANTPQGEQVNLLGCVH